MRTKGLFIGAFAAGLIFLGAGCSKQADDKGSKAPAAGVEQGQGVPADHANIATLDGLKARLKENPKDADTLLRLGDTYFEMKQFNESIVYYKKALEIKPDEADVYNDLGLSMHYIGNSAEGLRYIEEGVKKNPYHQRIWLTKGFILAYGMGDLESARAAWEKSRSLNPESQVGKAAADFLAQFNKK